MREARKMSVRTPPDLRPGPARAIGTDDGISRGSPNVVWWRDTVANVDGFSLAAIL
jgi:hypothetical protein